MNYIDEYFNEATQLLSRIKDCEKDKIKQVAELMSASIMAGNIAHIFGTGHSKMTGKEVFTRAGNLSCIRIIGHHYDLEKFERVEGIAALILADYEIRQGEVVFVVSTSGINPLPIETAMIAKEKGGVVVALTSLEHSKSVESRYKSGKKLFELADIVIDTHTIPGDAVVLIPGLPMRVGPLSTMANISIINSIVVETTAQIMEKGGTPPIRISRNIPGGDENNQKFKATYGPRIPEIRE
jgi:uncharacterized phosphosugar-binding protein